MKKFILTFAIALALPWPSNGGEITAGSVPGTLTYQGRLERDNAPITGTIHLYFRVYNSATANNASGGSCGGISQPCLWQSPEITAQATQGIFSADLTPPLSVLAGAQQLYLEVQVESDVLTPREPLNSVAYALIAKRLEDGADVGVSTLTAAYTVKLATSAGSLMSVGTDTPDAAARLTVNGWLKVVAGGIMFSDNTSMITSGVGSASGLSSVSDGDILADSNSDGTGDVVLRKPTLQFMRVTNSGKVGIGPSFTADTGGAPPNGLLDVDGAVYVGNEGIYDRDDSTVNVRESLGVDSGIIYGKSDEALNIGVANNVISLIAGGAERMRIHSNGYLGVGLASPASMIHSAADVAADSGLRGGRVSAGGYTGWASQANEVRAQDGYALLLQQSNPYNVGIGTATPREKLHVHGSVRSDYGVMAATAAFSSGVQVDGDLDANSSQGNMVYLSTTIIYGTLQVTGGIGSQAGIPVYINSTQTLTGQNTFLNQVVVSSDILTASRLGAGVKDFDFSGARYLQVGDNKPEYANEDARAYLVGGANADSGLGFYRGAVEAARFQTQGASNLALVISGSTKTLTDATYHRIQNSVVWISTGYNTTPSIYVSSYMGNVGMGTSVMDPNWKLTVAGNLRLSGSGSAIIFADGTSMTTSSAASANSISANGDAIVQSNADLSGGGDVILRAGSLDGLLLNTGGNVGIGTLNPVSRLNLRGGDLVLGTPYNPYSADSVEDLVVGGNIAFDGELVQRSALPVQLSGLIVANDVYLSTAPTARTGVGTRSPYTTFDVNGSAQFGAGVSKSTFTAAGALQLATQLAVPYGGTGSTSLTSGGILYGGGTGPISAMPVLTNGQLLIGDGAGAPAAATLTGTLNQVAVANGAGSITLSLPQDIHASATPSFTSVKLTGLTSGGILYGGGAGAVADTGVLANGQLLIGDGAGAPTPATLTQASANQVVITNGPGSITLSLPQDIHTGAAPTFANTTVASLTASSGTFRTAVAGGYSIATSSGINVAAGTLNVAQYLSVGTRIVTPAFRMPTGAVLNYVLASDASGNASWVNPAGGGLGDGWVGNEVTNASDATLTRSGIGTSGNPYTLGLNLNNANTWTASQAFSAGLSGTLTGNAATASALATARAINGVSFDGAAAINVPVNSADDTTTNAAMYPL